jgi:hypothetical protein
MKYSVAGLLFAAAIGTVSVAQTNEARVFASVPGGPQQRIFPGIHQPPNPPPTLTIDGTGSLTDGYIININVDPSDSATIWSVITFSTPNHIESVNFIGGRSGVTYQLNVGSEANGQLSSVAETIGAVTASGNSPVQVSAVAQSFLGSVEGSEILIAAAFDQVAGPITSTNGPVRKVRANRIGQEAGGVLTGPTVIQANAVVDADAEVLLVSSVNPGWPTPDGNMWVTIVSEGRTADVQAPSVIRGSITSGGTLPIVSVQGNAGIGTPTSPLIINAPGIENLNAGSFVFGSGTPLSGGNMHLAATLTGPITRMRAVRFNGVGGDFTGTLSAPSMTNNLADRLVIDDEHTGTIAITNTGQRDVITIGRDANLSAANLFTFGPGGLRGQVVINQNDVGSNWFGAAHVGTNLLVPEPDYANFSGPLGGGAIGVGTYRLHREDCVPSNTPVGGGPNTLGLGVAPDTSTWNFLLVRRDRFDDLPAAQDDLEVRMRWYGPISGSGCRLVTVERSTDPTFTDPGQIIDETARFYTGAEGPQDPNLLRDVRLRRRCGNEGLPSGFYRVVRNIDAINPPTAGGRLNSNLIAGEPEVRPFAFYFRLGGCNPADIAGANQSPEGDGQLTADDIIVFLNWYFGNDLRADIAGANQSSTPDGQLTADDIIVFLNFYFAGCANPDGPRACGEGEVEPPKCSKDGGFEDGKGGEQPSGQRMASMAQPSGAGDGASAAQRIANMQAMIAAEADPQRKAMLEAALAILQAAGGTGSGTENP